MSKKYSIQPQPSALKRADALTAPSPAVPTASTPSVGIPTGYSEPDPTGTVPTAGMPVASLPPASIPTESTPETGTADGFWQLANWVSDVLLPRLDPVDQVVMFRLYRLTLGFARDRCLVSYDKLAQRTKLGKNTVIRSVKRLVADGYLETRMVRTGGSGGQALEYRLLPPAIPPSGIPAKGIPTASTPKRGIPAAAPMTVSKDKREHAPVADAPSVYECRTIAARFVERHTPGYTLELLRADVRTVLAGEGREAGEDVISEATRGMLP